MQPPFPNSYWLEPGRILCGEYPRDFDDAGGHAAMATLLKSGIREFIDLTEDGELKPYWHIAEQTGRDLGISPSALIHRRFPVRDVSVPGSTEEMRAILRAVRAARLRGNPVYVHCWGGRGRTGTVSGCLLAEVFGFSGDAALDKLKELWAACAKASFSDSPETGEQRDFVLGWKAPELDNLIRGALLGAATGDALGVPVEFQGRERRVTDPVTGMREYGTHNQPAGTWSDDTSMILATIAGLDDDGGYNLDVVMGNFVRWVEDAEFSPHGSVFDIGIATRGAIRKFQSGMPALECGGTGEMSNGNGSLMRILPVALAFADDPGLIAKASEISSLTHAHERSRFCCAFHCLMVSELIHGGDLPDALGFAREVMDGVWEFSERERNYFEAFRPEMLLARDEADIGSDGHVIDTLEASAWVNGRHGDFAGAVLHAVNLGDDTDTTGCVAGGLAGLLHGEVGIPAEWLDVLVKTDDLAAAAARLSKFSLANRPPLPLP